MLFWDLAGYLSYHPLKRGVMISKLLVYNLVGLS